MSERFEIYLETKSLIANDDLLKLFNKLEVETDSLYTIDDWDYNNEHYYNIDKIKSINNLIDLKKIIIIEGTSCSAKCGAFIYQTVDLNYEYDFWFTIDTFKELAENRITDNNKYIYEFIFSLLKEYCDVHSIVFCAIGLEMYISEKCSLNEKLSYSSGVVRWIVQKECSAQNDFYVEEIKEDLKIYSIYSI